MLADSDLLMIYVVCITLIVFKWLCQLDDSKSLYIGNICFTKHSFETVCLGFQVYISLYIYAKTMTKFRGKFWSWPGLKHCWPRVAFSLVVAKKHPLFPSIPNKKTQGFWPSLPKYQHYATHSWWLKPDMLRMVLWKNTGWTPFLSIRISETYAIMKLEY